MSHRGCQQRGATQRENVPRFEQPPAHRSSPPAPAGPSCNVDGVHEPVVHVRGDRALPAPQVLAEDPQDEWRLADAAVMFADGEVVICAPSLVIHDRCPDTALRLEGRERAGFPQAHLVEGAVLLWISEERVLPPIFLAETAG